MPNKLVTILRPLKFYLFLFLGSNIFFRQLKAEKKFLTKKRLDSTINLVVAMVNAQENYPKLIKKIETLLETYYHQIVPPPLSPAKLITKEQKKHQDFYHRYLRQPLLIHKYDRIALLSFVKELRRTTQQTLKKQQEDLSTLEVFLKSIRSELVKNIAETIIKTNRYQRKWKPSQVEVCFLKAVNTYKIPVNKCNITRREEHIDLKTFLQIMVSHAEATQHSRTLQKYLDVFYTSPESYTEYVTFKLEQERRFVRDRSVVYRIVLAACEYFVHSIMLRRRSRLLRYDKLIWRDSFVQNSFYSEKLHAYLGHLLFEYSSTGGATATCIFYYILLLINRGSQLVCKEKKLLRLSSEQWWDRYFKVLCGAYAFTIVIWPIREARKMTETRILRKLYFSAISNIKLLSIYRKNST